MRQFVSAILATAVLALVGGCAATDSTGSKESQDAAAKTASSSDPVQVDHSKASAAASEAANKDVNLTPSEKEKKRQAISSMATDALARIYEAHPEAKAAVEKSHGYAVFDSTAVNLVLYVAGEGKGVAFKAEGSKPVYMNMVRAGTGPGVGYDDYLQLLVFTSEDAYKEFITLGVDVGASGDLGPLYSGSTSFNPDIKSFTVHEKDFDVQVNWGGVYYVKNLGLNEE